MCAWLKIASITFYQAYFASCLCSPLVLTTVTTCRKFFTILASVIFFGHELASRQWLGVALVSSGLAFEVIHSYRNHAIPSVKKTKD